MENERIGREKASKYTPIKKRLYQGLTIASSFVVLGGLTNMMYDLSTIQGKISSVPKPREVNTLKLGQRTIEQLKERKNNLLTKLYPPYENDATEKLRKFYKDYEEIRLIDNAIEEVGEDLSKIEKGEEVGGYKNKLKKTQEDFYKSLIGGLGIMLGGAIGMVTFLKKAIK